MKFIKFNYNNMYAFRYRPVGKGVLPVYDAAPLIFLLDVGTKVILGVNVHWIPVRYRQAFIDNVCDIMDKTQSFSKRKERSRLVYTMLKKHPFRIGLKGIRKYYLSRITNLTELPEAKWEKVLKIKRFKARFAKKKDNYRI